MKLISEEKVIGNCISKYETVHNKEIFAEGFLSGVDFAESELKNILLECIESIFDYEKESGSKICEFDRTPKTVLKTFIEQRNEATNGADKQR